MKALLFLLLLFLFNGLIFSQQKINISDSLEITNILYKQQRDWNIGDIDAFMGGYFKGWFFQDLLVQFMGGRLHEIVIKKLIQIGKKWEN